MISAEGYTRTGTTRFLSIIARLFYMIHMECLIATPALSSSAGIRLDYRSADIIGNTIPVFHLALWEQRPPTCTHGYERDNVGLRKLDSTTVRRVILEADIFIFEAQPIVLCTRLLKNRTVAADGEQAGYAPGRGSVFARSSLQH